LKYTVLLYEGAADEGGFRTKMAELPGCVTQGETPAAIRQEVNDAIEEYLHARFFAGKRAPVVPMKVLTFDGPWRW
jgi:predicted RNase H-like HicB family nuclease